VKGFVRNRGGVRQPNGSYRGGTWTAYWEEGKTPDGRRRQGSKGGFRTKGEALEYLAAVQSAKQQGSYVQPVKLTFGQYLTESWLPAQEKRLRHSSLSDYRDRINNYVLPTLGGIPLQDLNAAHLDRLYADLLARGGRRGQPLAPKTVRNVHAVISKALGAATRKRLVTRNVALDADPPKVPGPGEREMETWTPEELRLFLQAIGHHRLAAAYLLSASTGMRRGEVLGVRWSDLDLENATVSVRQTLISVRYEITLSEPKTARGHRTISLDPATVAVLRAHSEMQQADRDRHGEAYEDHNLVFARPDGRPLHPDYFSQTFDRTVKKLGLRKVRLHDLRHTYATLALRAGVDPKTVSARLGHATVAFTLDVYTKAVPQLDREAASKIAGLIFGDRQA
jgi:integrase